MIIWDKLKDEDNFYIPAEDRERIFTEYENARRQGKYTKRT